MMLVSTVKVDLFLNFANSAKYFRKFVEDGDILQVMLLGYFLRNRETLCFYPPRVKSAYVNS